MRSPKGILLLFAVIVCALFLAAPALASSPLNTYEKQLVAAINKQRAKHGLAAVRVNSKLVDSARAHSADMAVRKYFEHDSPDGETWSSRIVRYGYTRDGCSYWKTGENIYYGSGLYSSPYVAGHGVDEIKGAPRRHPDQDLSRRRRRSREDRGRLRQHQRRGVVLHARPRAAGRAVAAGGRREG